MREINIAKRFYKGISKKNLEDYFPNFAKEVPEESEVSRLSRIVFQPDETGNPTSDIEYYINCGDDAFRDYMRKVFLQRVDGELAGDDPEVVELTVKKNLVTYDEYFKAIDGYARSLMENVDGE